MGSIFIISACDGWMDDLRQNLAKNGDRKSEVY